MRYDSRDKAVSVFWSFVDKSQVGTGCWHWTGSTNGVGYGSFTRASLSKVRMTHRIAYELTIGAIPTGLELDHLCRDTLCCNPAHLEPVTRAENIRRGMMAIASRRKGERTHCVNGHEFTPNNTIMSTQNGFREGYKSRVCRACYRVTRQKWRIGLKQTA